MTNVARPLTPIYLLPSIVKAPGLYLTRCGETVNITKALQGPGVPCKGTYPNGVSESWHHTGRIFTGCETNNDIVGIAPGVSK